MIPSGPGAEFLVQGMGTELVPPHWPAITDDEASAVLAHYTGTNGPAVVTWRSPRPTSAAALVRTGNSQLFIKRHHRHVRDGAQLGTEHAFAAYLRHGGQPVPAVLATLQGATVVELDDYVYEVHSPLTGTDRYRQALSWSPFAQPAHAWAAGQALARFHLVSAGFPAPARPPAVLTNGTGLVTQPELVDAVARLAGARPGLQEALAGRPWTADLHDYLVGFARAAQPFLGWAAPIWGHGDWHASNLAWGPDDDSPVVIGVFDLGLANRTCALHDLAVAIERNCIDWLDLAGAGTIGTDLAAMSALVSGYDAVRPLDRPERAALVAVLPVCHVDHAFSELEYFAAVTASRDEADLAYDSYLLGHARWFRSSAGELFLAAVEEVLASLSVAR